MTIATIKALERRGVQVKISDVSSALNLPRPGVTRTVREMEDRGYLRKTASDADGRITYLSITDAGKALSQTYNERFFSRLAPLLTDISEEDAACTIRTIERLYQIMSERRIPLA